MRLSIFTDYSLRVLLYLALMKNHASTRRDVAAAYGISDNHLMKVVNFLGRRGYIKTTRGKGGGIRLAKMPQEINIGDLARACESRTPFLSCLNPKNPRQHCRLSGVCLFKEMLGEGADAFFATLSRHTLAEVTADKVTLLRQMAISDESVTL